MDVRRYNTDMRGMDGLVVVRFDGPMYFANAPRFKNMIFEIAGKNTEKKEDARRQSADASDSPELSTTPSVTRLGKAVSEVQLASCQARNSIYSFTRDLASKPSFIILDCSAIVSIDCTALHILTDMIRELNVADRKIKFVFAGILPSVYDTLVKGGITDILEPNQLFFSAQDAVCYYIESNGV